MLLTIFVALCFGLAAKSKGRTMASAMNWALVGGLSTVVVATIITSIGLLITTESLSEETDIAGSSHLLVRTVSTVVTLVLMMIIMASIKPIAPEEGLNRRENENPADFEPEVQNDVDDESPW